MIKQQKLDAASLNVQKALDVLMLAQAQDSVKSRVFIVKNTAEVVIDTLLEDLASKGTLIHLFERVQDLLEGMNLIFKGLYPKAVYGEIKPVLKQAKKQAKVYRKIFKNNSIPLPEEIRQGLIKIISVFLMVPVVAVDVEEDETVQEEIWEDVLKVLMAVEKFYHDFTENMKPNK